jgi:hypothetical protein
VEKSVFANKFRGFGYTPGGLCGSVAGLALQRRKSSIAKNARKRRVRKNKYIHRGLLTNPIFCAEIGFSPFEKWKEVE